MAQLPTQTPPELVQKILETCPEELPTPTQVRAAHAGMHTGMRGKDDDAKQRYKWWSPETRIRAVALYMAFGNMNKVAKSLDMPAATLRRWKMEDWWADVVKKVRSEHNDEMDSKMSGIIAKTLDAVTDRIENGDTIVMKDGSKHLVPAKLADLTRTLSTVVDKRNLLRGEPTSRSENVSVNQRLEALKEQFRKFTNAKEIEAVPVENLKTVDGAGYTSTEEGQGEAQVEVSETKESQEG